jgi:hypothetical protein
VLFVRLLDVVDGPTAAATVAALAALAALAFGWNEGRVRIAAAVALAVFAGWTVLGGVRAKQQDPLVRLAFVKGEPEPKPRWESWNCFSRVAVFGDPDEISPPFGWGLSDTFSRKSRKRQLGMNIDATAATVLTHFEGDLNEVDHLRSDITRTWCTSSRRTPRCS